MSEFGDTYEERAQLAENEVIRLRTLLADRDRLAEELHETRIERRREHELRCRILGELETVQAELAQARADRHELRLALIDALNYADWNMDDPTLYALYDNLQKLTVRTSPSANPARQEE